MIDKEVFIPISMDEEEAEKSLVFTNETKVTNGKEEVVQKRRISLRQLQWFGN